jgi:hypothetical protein
VVRIEGGRFRGNAGARGTSAGPPQAPSRADALMAVAESWLSSVAASEGAHDTAGQPVELIVQVDHAALAADAASNAPDTVGPRAGRDARDVLEPHQLAHP